MAELDANAATVETAATESEALVKDLAEQKDLHLRLAADFEKFKRRSRQESEVCDRRRLTKTQPHFAPFMGL